MTIAADEVTSELSPAKIERDLFAVHFRAGVTR